MSSRQSLPAVRARGPNRKLEDSEIARLKQVYRANPRRPVMDICAEFGISKQTLYNYLHEENPPAPDTSAEGTTTTKGGATTSASNGTRPRDPAQRDPREGK